LPGRIARRAAAGGEKRADRKVSGGAAGRKRVADHEASAAIAAGSTAAGMVSAGASPGGGSISSVAEQAELDRVRRALERRRAGHTLGPSDVKAIRDYEEKRAGQAWWFRTRRLPQKDLCTLLGVNREQIRRWKAADLPSEQDGHDVYYDLPAVIGWLRRYWQGGVEGDGVETSKRAAEIKLLIRREAALQLKMQLMSGELVHRDDVERGRCERIKMVRGGLEALKRSLAPAVLELGEEATLDQAEALIWDYVEPLLKAFGGQPRRQETRRHGERETRGNGG